MPKNGNKFLNFNKKVLRKLKPRFSFHYVAYTTLIFAVVFSFIHLVSAVTPNPGHPWSEVGDGVFTFTSGQTSTNYTYTFPAANATVLTTNAAVTIAQGGTGLTSIAAGSILAANSANTLSAVTSTSGTKVLTNTSGTISWETASSGMVYPGSGIPNSTGSSWGTSYSTTGSGSVVALATSPTFSTSIFTPYVIGGTGTTSDLYLQTTSGTGTTGADMHFLVGSNGGTEAMTILNSGYVGIGTTGPLSPLHVENSSGNAMRVTHTNAGGYTNIQLYEGTTRQGAIQAIGSAFGTANRRNNLEFYSDLGDITYWTGSSERVRITSTGNVGIGTTSPTAVLHLKAGTATANTSPLKFTSGTLLTTPESGAVEYDGTNLYYTDSTPTRQTLVTSSSLTSSLGNYVPYTGATGDVNLGAYDLTTTGLTVGGLADFSGSVAIDTDPDNNASGFEYGNGFDPYLYATNYENERFRVNSFFESPFVSMGVARNYLLYTEDFSNASWVKTGVGTVSANGAIAPNGATIAENIPAGSADTSGVSQVVTNSSTGYWSAGVWARTQSGTATIKLRIDSSTETGTEKEFNIDTSWRFFSIAQNFTSANTTKTLVFVTGQNAVSLWGARMNPGQTVNAYYARTSSASTSLTPGVFFNNNTVYGTFSGSFSGNASSSNYSTMGSYGGVTLSNTSDKSGTWELIGYVTLTYNSTYSYGQSFNYEMKLKEVNNNEANRSQSDYEDITLKFKGNLAAASGSSATFNSNIPSFSVDVSGDTSLTGSDFAALVYSTSTSAKVLRLYVKLPNANSHYNIIPINYGGASYSSSLGVTSSSSYIVWTSSSSTAIVSSLPTPAQGSVAYGNLRYTTLGGNGIFSGTLTGTALISPKWYPSADGVTALGVYKADGVTNILNIDTTNSRLGVGITSPTALVHLAAGTATAGTAPLKLTAGTNLTTPEAGAVEYDGTSLYYTDSTPTRQTLVTSSSLTTTLGSYLLATGGTTGATSQAQTFTNGVITGKVYPSADSTTAFQINKADGTTNVLNVDTTNGRVGIGTTPGYTLSVVSPAGYLNSFSDGTREARFYTASGVMALGSIRAGDDWRFFVDNNSSRGIDIQTGTGNVGIGTTSPWYALDVQGNSAGIVGTSIKNSNSAGQARFQLQSDRSTAANQGFFSVYGSTYSGSAFGQTVNDMVLFDVSGSSNRGFIIGNEAAAPIIFGTNNLERFRIDGGTGNVGIGTTSPSELLSLGTAGTKAGVLSLAGATSGKAIIQVNAVAGTPTLTLPTTTGTLALTSDITAQTYPSAGIAVSTGSAWGTSITDNSANWNSAYTFTNGYATNYPDLTAIEALSGTSGLLKKTAANTWTLDTNTYLTSLSGALLATGATTGATSQAQVFTNGVTLSNLTASKVVFTDASKNLTSTGIGTSSQFIKGDGSLDSTTYVSGTPWTSMGYLTANQSITLSGAVTGTGTTSITTSLADNTVSAGKMQGASSTKLANGSSGNLLKSLGDGTFGWDTNTYLTSSALSSYVPTSRTLTINGTSYDLSANRSWTISSSMVYPGAGIAVSTGSAWGTSITDNSANWNTAYTNRISSLTTTGSSGSATLSSNVLNIPTYTLTGLGGQAQLNGTGFVKANGTTITYDNSTYLTSLSGALLVTGATTGATSQAQTFTNGVNLSNLTQGYLPYASNASKLLGNSGLYWDSVNSRLGIGTATPTTDFHLKSSGTTTMTIETSGYVDPSLALITPMGEWYLYNDYSNKAFGLKYGSGGSDFMTVSADGFTGFGISDPNAIVQIKAGASTYAPLKFTSGTNLTIAQAGAMEYDGTSLYFTPSGTTRRTIAYTSDITTSPVTIVNTSNLFSTGLSGTGSGVTSTTNSIFLGVNAGNGATGAYSSNFIGYNAGNGGETSYESNFIGYNAGNGATSAEDANFIGVGAGYGATGAYSSTFIGYAAGNYATGAYESNFIGNLAGDYSSGAYSSNFFGSNAGYNAENAYKSTFFGLSAGNGATNASNSIFIGQQAGKDDTVNNTTDDDDWSILIGYNTNTGGFKNSILLGGSNSTTAIANTKANQFMLADTITDVRWRGIEYSLPSAQGSSGQVLTNNGSGGLSWTSAGGGMSIGGAITNATEGSVLFVGASGVLAENSGLFNWDDTNALLGIEGDVFIKGQNELRFGDSGELPTPTYLSFKAPATVSSSVTWTLPSADARGCFQSDGSGTMSIGACGDTNEQLFASNGNYTKPTNALMTIVELWGGGGGGGGGYSGTVGTIRSGGAGGGGGAYTQSIVSASHLSSSIPVTVGSSGTAGTTVLGSGMDGGAGGRSCFSSSSSCGGTIYASAYGGGGGNGGSGTGGSGGGGGGGALAVGTTNGTQATGGTGGNPLGAGAGAANSGAGGAGGATAAATGAAGGAGYFGGAGGGSSSSTGAGNSGAGGGSYKGGSGGGAGGSIATAYTLRQGGAGGSSSAASGGGGSAGTTQGAAGGAGAAGVMNGGAGGGGGATGSTVVGGAGGAGGQRGGGGGGGGASNTTSVGAAGGLGGAGYVRIFTLRGAGADLAEAYGSFDDTLIAGEVVALDQDMKAGVKRTSKAYDNGTIGVISTDPGLIIGNIEDNGAEPVLVALSGRVPVKVNMENGPIHKGDYITASSEPGVAMRATKAGTIIGQAMTEYTDENTPGYIVVFIKSGPSNGVKLTQILPGLSLDSTPSDESSDTIDSADITDTTDTTGEEVVGETTGDGEEIAEEETIQKMALEYFLANKMELSEATEISEIYTDRLSAALEIITPTVITDTLSTNSVVVSTGEVIAFNSPAEFVVPPLFNSDTAGFALIKEGDKRVRVEYKEPYIGEPVVSADLAFNVLDGITDIFANNLFDDDLKFMIVDSDQEGFTILINQEAPRDLRFSWTALSVKDPQVFESVIEGLIFEEETTTNDTSTDEDVITEGENNSVDTTIDKKDEDVEVIPEDSVDSGSSGEEVPDTLGGEETSQQTEQGDAPPLDDETVTEVPATNDIIIEEVIN